MTPAMSPAAPPRIAGAPVLETARLILRAPVAEDWEGWRAFAASDRARYVGGPHDLAGAWRSFCHVVGAWVARGYGFFVFARKEGGPALGHAGPWRPADWPEAEIGWSVWSPEAEGKGFAREAAEAARAHAFRDLGWTTAVSYIHPENARSIRLAERLGARLDPAARTPWDDEKVLVYRHPAPASAAAFAAEAAR